MGALKRWIEYRPTKEHVFWIGVGCIVATLVAGFGLGGWVTGGSAKRLADEAAVAARNELAAAVCAEEFMRAADAGKRLAKLKALEWWERDDQVAAGGWATMPGDKDANGAVATMCAARLSA
jgi:hypothetical protein